MSNDEAPRIRAYRPARPGDQCRRCGRTEWTLQHPIVGLLTDGTQQCSTGCEPLQLELL